VSHLRHVLGSKAAIRARAPGYVLDLGGDDTDVARAERLFRLGTQSADPAEGTQQLSAAVALWRGPALADVTGLAWLEEQAERLDLLGAQIRRALVEARLAAGEHAQLIPELEQLTAEHPLDEQAHAQLMLALYRCGRQADALAAYHGLRQTLDDELGIDPSQQLRDLEMAILRQDQALAVPARAVAVAPATPVPAQLPPAVPGLAGRTAELASLDAILPGRAQSAGSGGAVVIAALSGTAGVGKTALAVSWAHRVSEQFPDGQLYVNLRGFDPGGAAVEPGEAMRGFLDALGVPVARIPAGLPEQAGLYRSLLAGKRMLVLLDNARDVEQVRPLLPGSPGCLALVTSRNNLTGLVADGAHALSLDLVTVTGARDLLARRLGARRVADEPEAVSDIIAGCARLPLALTIAAARAAASPLFPLAVFAAELSEATRAARALDPFHGGDLATDVRAVFSWSYRALTDDAARLFRLLGVHRGPDIAVPAAASLAGIPVSRARALLGELARAHLIAEHRPGRYACHDLLRAYAAEQARALDSADARALAARRVLDHYLHTAHQAATLMEPFLRTFSLAPAAPCVVVSLPARAHEALDWFTAEHAVLLAAVSLAAETGLEAHAWQLAWTLNPFLLRRDLWHDQALAQQAGLDAARQAGDRQGEAHAMHGLALGYARSGRFEQAQPVFEQALAQFAQIDDDASQASIHNSLTWLSERQQRPADALRHALRAFDLYGAAARWSEQVMALNDIGYCHALLGNYKHAIDYCERALAGARDLGERNWEAATLHSLGYIHHQLGSYRQAIRCYERSVDLCRELADRYNEAGTLDSLGDVHHSAGDTAAARAAWSGALRVLDEIDHPDGDQIRVKLRQRTVAPARITRLREAVPVAG
jgi:tetratricopeptide (TPR) repeat protein